MNIIISTLVFSICIHVGSKVYAQEVIETTRDMKIVADDPASAKQQMMDQAVEELSLESIKSIIGTEKADRSREVIENKIIKNSTKYILSLQGQNFSKQGGEYQMTVGIKMSLKNLRAILLEQGLLYQMEGPPKVLPIIQIVDRVGGRSFGWWYQKQTRDMGVLSEYLSIFNKDLKSELHKIGFYTLMPIDAKMGSSLPDIYRSENLQKADDLFLGEYFKCSLVIRGQFDVRLKPGAENLYLVDVKLEALHTANGRVMAELSRTFETDAGQYRAVINKKLLEIFPKVAEDLSEQLSDAWKKGTFGASVIRMIVKSKISPTELDEFKKMMILNVRDIKALRERIIEAGKVTYEIDSSANPAMLAKMFRSTKFNKFKVQVEDVTAQSITLKIETY